MKYILLMILLTMGTLMFSQPTGAVFQYAGEEPPEGYITLRGQYVFVSDFKDLFNVIGYEYGGQKATFKLPNPSEKLWNSNGFQAVEHKTIVRTKVRTGSGSGVPTIPTEYKRLNYIIKI
jgi:microcystin-dependent protein